jgi:hypothetical protein
MAAAFVNHSIVAHAHNTYHTQSSGLNFNTASNSPPPNRYATHAGALLHSKANPMNSSNFQFSSKRSFLPTIAHFRKSNQTIDLGQEIFPKSKITEIWKSQFKRYPPHIQELYLS